MSVETEKNLLTSDWFDDEDSHYVCCDLPDDFAGLTTTYCGKELFETIGPEVYDIPSCNNCINIDLMTFHCPLGHECGIKEEIC